MSGPSRREGAGSPDITPMLIALAVLCTLIEAIFTALEVALSTVSRARLRALTVESHEHDEEETHKANHGTVEKLARQASRAQLALRVVEQPDRLTLLFLTVTSFSLWTVACLLTWQALMAEWAPYTLAGSLALVLFCAEVLPLLVAARRAEALALMGAPFVRIAQTVLAPVLAVVGGIAYGIARIFGAGPEATPSVTEGELRTALATAEEEGVIEKEERALLEGAMDFRDKVVREVMTPRIDVVGVPCDASLSHTLSMALKGGHSRLPVYEGTLDRIVGIVATKDLLPYLHRGDGDGIHARDVVRPAFYVPETKPIASTLEELRRQRTLLAVVVDSDGGTAGLVTLEDLLEELVGEIQDEYDVEEPPLRVVEESSGQRVVLCEAGSTVRDLGRFLQREFHIEPTLRDGDSERAEASLSLAALALDLFESVPKVGDKIVVGDGVASTADIRASFGLLLEVAHMEGPRIEEVRIRLVAQE